MKAPLKITAPPFELTDILSYTLNTALEKCGELNNSTLPNAITFNFRDEKYSAEHGGYHPVEIRIEKQGDEYFVSYITDFCYVGTGDYAELVKDVDFDFRDQQFYLIDFPSMPIEEGEELFTTLIFNFASYYQMDAYSVEISFD